MRRCLHAQAYAKSGHTLLQMQAALKRGQAISPYVSTQYKTAVCFDPTLKERNLFEMNLNQLSLTHRGARLLQGYDRGVHPSDRASVCVVKEGA